ncbi:hypothetical protein [Vibrio hangzhouensis]|uniref:Glutamate racemase n=1 Tax=Vibrio hangzhouensis TaxID=462991 RepID=A0A1H6A9X3_9VIBR|nr:hypothetical protein [Vibrio hangzhouensis]SEG45110.1 hypothetical protein SAMN04488244_114102 [Vibrio hangzhouensis]
MKILFLHTLDNNAEIFAPLAASRFPQHDISHDVQEHFLTEIRNKGQNEHTKQAIHNYLTKQISNGIDYIICTCSTLGPVVDSFPNDNVFRVDKPMASESAKFAHVLVAVTLESTIEPTGALLNSQAPNTKFYFKLIEGAWDLYAEGNLEKFNHHIAKDLNQELQQDRNYQAIMLAQASMMNAAPLISQQIRVLTSPYICLDFLAEHLN